MTGPRNASTKRAARDDESAASTRVWQEFLSSELRCPVRVIYTRARRTPLQVRPAARAIATGSAQRATRETSAPRASSRAPGISGLEVRMHAMFVEAPPHVHDAVVSWIRSGRRAPRACAVLDRWIAESLERLPIAAPRDTALRARGAFHDLEALKRELLAAELAAEFAGDLDHPRVTWGRQGQSRTRHSLRLGSFDPEGRIVRIHPVLDQVAVPVWFVRYVVFHELLHAVLPPRPGRGSRWIHHGAEFRRRERAYADYERAIAWEKAHMRELIRSARRAAPMPIAAARPSDTVRRDTPTRDTLGSENVRNDADRRGNNRNETGVHDTPRRDDVNRGGVRRDAARDESSGHGRPNSEPANREPSSREPLGREQANRETVIRASEVRTPNADRARPATPPNTHRKRGGERSGTFVHLIQAWLFPE
jgi:hypothetical protein